MAFVLVKTTWLMLPLNWKQQKTIFIMYEKDGQRAQYKIQHVLMENVLYSWLVEFYVTSSTLIGFLKLICVVFNKIIVENTKP